MRTWTKVVAALAAAVVLAVGGLVVLVASGATDDVWNECTDANQKAADDIADVVRRELPGREGDVDVVGDCSKSPYRTVVATTRLERRELATELRRTWGCRQQRGTSPPAWECRDAGGFEVEIDVDGQEIAVMQTVFDRSH